MRRTTRLLTGVVSAALAVSLAACGVTADALPELAVEAAAQWTARFNPRPVAAAHFEQLYRAALTEGEG